jgi:hypothetical protein
MKELKYKKELEEVMKKGCDCPPAEAREGQLVAYRWVFNPITDTCFLPQALRNPKRVLNAKSTADECSCWGLSMHTCEKSSKRAYRAVKSSLRQAEKIFGGFIAEGVIDHSSGLSTIAESNGHFDLHPFEGFCGTTSFKVVGKA